MINIKSYIDHTLTARGPLTESTDSGNHLWAVCYEGEDAPDFFGLYRTEREAIYAKSKSDLAQLVGEYDWQFNKGGYTGTFGDWMKEFEYDVDNYYGLMVQKIDLGDKSRHEEYIIRAISEPPYTGEEDGAPTQTGEEMAKMLIDHGVNPVNGMTDPSKLISMIERKGGDMSWMPPHMQESLRRASKTRSLFKR